MKTTLTVVAGWAIAYCLLMGGARMYMKYNVTKTHGAAMWKAWR